MEAHSLRAYFTSFGAYRHCLIGSGIGVFVLLNACSFKKSELKKDQSSDAVIGSSALDVIQKELSPSAHKPSFSLKEALGECDSVENEAWSVYHNAPQRCDFPTVTYRCKRILSGEVNGAEMLQAIVDARQNKVIWKDVIASEEIPSAHSERIYTQTQLRPIDQKSGLSHPCRPFTAVRVQKARSFNLVDAREEEFDEASEDEILFEYSVKAQRYLKVDDEQEVDIKVRSR